MFEAKKPTHSEELPNQVLHRRYLRALAKISRFTNKTAARVVRVMAIGSEQRGFISHVLRRVQHTIVETLVGNKVRQLQQLTLEDGLTGLPNKRALSQRLVRQLSHLKRIPIDTFSLIFMDVNDFKNINDQQGHAGGDTKLQEIAKILKANLRPEDGAFRYGGDEMILIIAGDQNTQRVVLERLYDKFKGIGITVSSGAVLVTNSNSKSDHSPLPSDIGEKVIQAADGLMYEAKQEFRGRTKNPASITRSKNIDIQKLLQPKEVEAEQLVES